MSWRIRIERWPEIHVPPQDAVQHVRRMIASAICRAENANPEWAARHFISHRNKAYLVIPNLYSGDPNDVDECTKALAINQLAGMLIDHGIVRWPQSRKWWLLRQGELDKLKAEEKLGSGTDLTDVRKAWLKELKGRGIPEEQLKDEALDKAMPLRNHGLFSKAERALAIAGWSEKARRDIEIFPLTSADALTLVLVALSEPLLSDGSTVDAASSTSAQ